MAGSSSPRSGSPVWSRTALAIAVTRGLAEARASEIWSSPAAVSARVLRALSWVATLAAVSTDWGRPTSSPHSASVKPKVAYSGSSVTGSSLLLLGGQQRVLLDDRHREGLVADLLEQHGHPILLVAHHHSGTPVGVPDGAVHGERLVAGLFLGL